MTEVQEVTELPRIISVDDHVFEPADLWSARLPAKFRERGPRIEREKGRFGLGEFGACGPWERDDEGGWADFWRYEDLSVPLDIHKGAAGYNLKAVDYEPITFEDIRPGCYRQADRLADMDANHTDVQVCFPNTLPRFCGQVFTEAKDKDLALLCVRAYNDWVIDEWCAGPGYGRLIPLSILPLWDPQLAAEEVLRCAEKGCYAVTFSEDPYKLGLPTLYSGKWDVFFAACEQAEATICVHIGSSSTMPTTTPDAPFLVRSILLTSNAAGSLLDLVMSGVLQRFPGLKVAYSETDVGWMPYLVQKMDERWSKKGRFTQRGGDLPELPSSYLRDRVFGCVIDDEVGLSMQSRLNNQVCFETDYPHADTTWPHSIETARTIIEACHLNDSEIYDFLRGNAIYAFGLKRFGISK